MYRSILLATDGTAGALGAARVAREVAALHNAQVEVVAVHDPSPLMTGFDDPFIAAHSVYDAEAASALLERVAAQIAEVDGPASSWTVTVKHGPVAPMIVRAASEGHASLIVLGLRRYGRREHWIGRETPLRVMHLAHVPVLAVPASAQRLARRAVLATDLGPVSMGAARAARSLASPDAAIHLAYVLTGEVGGGGKRDEASDGHRAEVRRRLADLEEDLTHGTSLHGHIHVLSGDASDAILRLAHDTAAGLIAVGSHSYSLFERLLLGSVASRIVRGAECAVLVAPAAQVPSVLRGNVIESELLAHLGRRGSVASHGRNGLEPALTR